MNEWLQSNMSFILLRSWAYFCHYTKKSVSLASLALILSTQVVIVLITLTNLSFAPAIATSLLINYFPPAGAYSTTTSNKAVIGEARNDNTFSNITLLDLYPELKEYLWKKALSQISSTTTSPKNLLAISQTEVPPSSYYSLSYAQPTDLQQQQQPQYNTASSLGQNGWGWGAAAEYGNIMPPLTSSHQYPPMNSRESTYDSDSQMSSYNYNKEVLKHWHPFGTPEFYDSWKFKPSPPVAASHSSHSPSSGWSSIWEEENHSHELSKDFSCLAGLLGLKTLKTLKFATIFKKLKLIAIFFIAFKLGVLLSPIAIPLLFPIIILVTVVKILPLILIIVLLLKILKKQVKVKKPFGKFLDSTGSLFFDDVEAIAEKVMKSGDEFIDKLSRGIQKKSSSGKRRSKSNKDDAVDDNNVKPISKSI